MGCGEFLVKYILFFTNLFFALSGLALMGLGIAVQLQVTVITDLFHGTYQVAPIITIVAGAVVFLIAFLGCCGAIRESNCLLVTYATFMVVLMVIKFSLAILIFVNLDAFKSEIPVLLNTAFNGPNRESFNVLEKTFKCCGTTGPLSYGTVVVSDTCCAPGTILATCTQAEAYQLGCNQALIDLFDVYGKAIGAVTIVIVAIELVAIVFSLCLANHVRNKYRRNQY